MTFTAVINACTTCKEWEIGLDLFNHLTEEIRNEIYLLAAIHECMVKNDQQEKAD
jgi:pentatricopeptide repeat protein